MNKDYEKVKLNSINEILGRVDIESSLYRFWEIYSKKYDEYVYLVFEDIDYENNYNNTVNIKGIFRIDTSDKSLLFEDEFTFNNVDRKSTRLNSSHVSISYAVFCLKKKTITIKIIQNQIPARA